MKINIETSYLKAPKILGVLALLSFLGVLFSATDIFLPKILFTFILAPFLINNILNLFNSKPNLKIDSKGITNNTDIKSLGFVEWNDISKIEFKKSRHGDRIYINLKKPQKYFKIKNNGIKALLAKTYFNITRTSIAIDCTHLDYDFSMLKETIRSFYLEKKTQGNKELW